MLQLQEDQPVKKITVHLHRICHQHVSCSHISCSLHHGPRTTCGTGRLSRAHAHVKMLRRQNSNYACVITAAAHRTAPRPHKACCVELEGRGLLSGAVNHVVRQETS
ncbi:hypothetical protein SEVIR_2G245401v4 [Setaria viridis]